jgi:hypothetical protein
MERQLLIERLDSSLVVEETAGGLVFRGIFQKADTVNANGRVYPRAVLEKALKEYQKLIDDNRAVGTLEHPEDNKTYLDRISHKITKVWMEEDGTVWGEAIALDTSAGRELQALLKAKVKVGISSRGWGTVQQQTTEDGKLVEIINDDYVLEAFDVVYSPSTPNAYVFVEHKKEVKNMKQKSLQIMKKRRGYSRYKVERLVESLLKACSKETKYKLEDFAQKLLSAVRSKSLSVQESIVFDAVKKMIAPLIDDEVKKFVIEDFTKINKKDSKLEEEVNFLRLENYKLRKALEESIDYKLLEDCKSVKEVNERILEEKEKLKRSVSIGAIAIKEEKEDAVQKWETIFKRISIRR